MKINYKSDFSAILQVFDGQGNDVGFPDYDFTAEFYTSGVNKYVASSIGGVLTNCQNNDGRILVLFDNHKLGVGQLQVRFIAQLPAEDYPDTRQQICSPKGDTGIELVLEAALPPDDVQIQAILPYIKGKPFTYDDFTEQQLKDLSDGVLSQVQPDVNAAIDTLNATNQAAEQAESERIAAETLRSENEQQRIANEQSRTQAEVLRTTDESTRAANEKQRIEAETARAESEQTRVSNEQNRVSAESKRTESEQQRELAEQKRANSEQQRADAETLRVSAESKRAEAESARVKDEQSRTDAEALRSEAESTRLLAEAERKNAETLRSEAEAERINAETQRTNDEQSRIAAEQQRVLNEQERIERALSGAYSIDFGVEATTASDFNCEGVDVTITEVSSVNVSALTLACGGGEPTEYVVGQTIAAGSVAVWSIERAAEGVEAAVGVRYKRNN